MLALTLAQAVLALDFVILMPLAPRLIRAFAIDPARFGLLVSIYPWAAAMSGLAFSRVAGRISTRTALLVSLGVLTLGTVACGLAQSMTTFAVARGLSGVAGGILGGSVLAMTSATSTSSGRGTRIGKVMSGSSMAILIGIPLALLSSNFYGWRAPFFLVAVLSLQTIVLCKRSLTFSTPRSERDEIREAGPDVSALPTAKLLMSAAVTFSSFLVIPLVSTSLVANAGVSNEGLIWVYLVGGVLSVISSRWAGAESKRRGGVPAFLALATGSLVTTLIVTHLGLLPLGAVTIAVGTFMSVNAARLVAATNLLAGAARTEDRRRLFALNTALQQFSMGTAAFLGGAWVSTSSSSGLLGFGISGWMSCVVTLVAIALALTPQAASLPKDSPKETRLKTFVSYALFPVVMFSLVALFFRATRAGAPVPAAILGLIVLTTALLHFLEKLLPFRQDWIAKDGQEVNDLGHAVLGTYLGSRVGNAAVLAVGAPAAIWLSERLGSRIWPTSWPLAEQVVAIYLVADFGRYWEHRLMHEVPSLWRFHALHHTPDRLTVVRAFRNHFIERFIQQILSFAGLAVAGVPGSLILLYSVPNIILGLITHSNVDFRLGFLEYVINGPVAHRLHHSIRMEEGNRNFGSSIVVWDWVFGTFENPVGRTGPVEVGTRERVIPAGFLPQILSPFIWKRLANGSPASRVENRSAGHA